MSLSDMWVDIYLLMWKTNPVGKFHSFSAFSDSSSKLLNFAVVYYLMDQSTFFYHHWTGSQWVNNLRFLYWRFNRFLCRNVLVSTKNLIKKIDLSLIATCSVVHAPEAAGSTKTNIFLFLSMYLQILFTYTQKLIFAKIKHHSILYVYNWLALRPSLITIIGKRDLFDNGFRFYAWWGAKPVLDPEKIWWNEIINRKEGLLVQM